MYCINVTYTACDRQSIRDFYNEIRKMRIAEITRQEAGNLGYEYYFSADRSFFWKSGRVRNTSRNMPVSLICPSWERLKKSTA